MRHYALIHVSQRDIEHSKITSQWGSFDSISCTQTFAVQDYKEETRGDAILWNLFPHIVMPIAGERRFIDMNEMMYNGIRQQLNVRKDDKQLLRTIVMCGTRRDVGQLINQQGALDLTAIVFSNATSWQSSQCNSTTITFTKYIKSLLSKSWYAPDTKRVRYQMLIVSCLEELSLTSRMNMIRVEVVVIRFFCGWELSWDTASVQWQVDRFIVVMTKDFYLQVGRKVEKMKWFWYIDGLYDCDRR